MATNSPSFASTQYGAPIGEYRGGGIVRVIGIGIIGALLLTMGIFGVAAPLYVEDSGKAIFVDIFGGILLIAGALYAFWTIFRVRGAHAQLFEQGFIISRGGKTTSAHWDDITSVTQKITRIRYNGIPVGTSYLFTISLANGETVRVDNTFRKIDKLGDTIQRMSANVLLPRAIASYQSGASLPFGKISISQAGVSNGKETVPWSNITQFSLQNGGVIIRRTDKRLAWVTTPIARTPNPYVLMALVDRIQHGAL